MKTFFPWRLLNEHYFHYHILGTNILHCITLFCREEHKHILQSSPECMRFLDKQELGIFYSFWGTVSKRYCLFYTRRWSWFKCDRGPQESSRFLSGYQNCVFLLLKGAISSNHSFLLSYKVRSTRWSYSDVMESLVEPQQDCCRCCSSNIKIQASKKESKGLFVLLNVAHWVCYFLHQVKCSESVLINWKEIEMIYTPTCLRPANMTMWNFMHHTS